MNEDHRNKSTSEFIRTFGLLPEKLPQNTESPHYPKFIKAIVSKVGMYLSKNRRKFT